MNVTIESILILWVRERLRSRYPQKVCAPRRTVGRVCVPAGIPFDSNFFACHHDLKSQRAALIERRIGIYSTQNPGHQMIEAQTP
jgi:hypothetical protein